MMNVLTSNKASVASSSSFPFPLLSIFRNKISHRPRYSKWFKQTQYVLFEAWKKSEIKEKNISRPARLNIERSVAEAVVVVKKKQEKEDILFSKIDRSPERLPPFARNKTEDDGSGGVPKFRGNRLIYTSHDLPAIDYNTGC